MILDLSRPWTDYPVCVADFETTGVDPLTCEPVEIAVVRFERDVPTARFVSLLKPKNPIPESAREVHGITDEMVNGAPTLEDVAGEIARVAADAVPCAYNAPYDATVLHRYISGSDVPLFDPEQGWLDPFVMAASAKQDRYVSGSGRLKLAEVCRRRGIIISDAHRAEFDAIAAGKLLYMLMGESKPTLGDLLARVALRRAEHDADYLRFRFRRWIGDASLDELRKGWRLIGECQPKQESA